MSGRRKRPKHGKSPGEARFPLDGLALRKRRSAEFWRFAAPYLREAGGSLPGLLAISGLGIYLYRSFLSDMPENFPTIAVLTAALGCVAVWTPIRTYVREPDRVYLMPAESALGGYFKAALRSAFWWQAALAAALLWIAWPLYRAGGGEQPYGLVLAVLWLVKALNVYAVWQQTYLREQSHRRLAAAGRAVATFASVYAALAYPAPVALIAAGVCFVVWFCAVLRIPPRHSLGWETLIDLERRQRLRWISALNPFTDVPREEAAVKRRGALGRLARMIPMRERYAYDYLYALTWLRSELFGMTVRLTALGAVLLVAVDGNWQRAAVYAAAALLTGRQLRELAAFHPGFGYGPTLSLPPERRQASLRRVTFVLQAAALTLMLAAGIAGGWSLGWAVGTWAPAVAASYAYTRRIAGAQGGPRRPYPLYWR
ncbi:ABC transporter permease [Paenibacillus thermoaerophilus]|uniref:ABC transporter permease n=1 Tax=Paenibacillus thermoaerophilus TaxID=1215385 RepID=A0ABW2V1B8_9BACL|nr:ABC transporter permease [Paenibacillus thermoaerophilus]TMV18469.1 ABC transporter permease [Paenibacillus thermoaerophilus]